MVKGCLDLQINLDVLRDANLSPSNYTLLYLKFCDAIERCYWKQDLRFLEKEGYIKIIDEGFALRQKAIDLFETRESKEEECWLEFKSAYPIKDGRRRLHDQQGKCREKYFKLIRNNPREHDLIMKGLLSELESRRQALLRRQFFPQQKSMSAWINQSHWLTYLEETDLKGNPVDKPKQDFIREA